jgi:hypothetical protein
MSQANKIDLGPKISEKELITGSLMLLWCYVVLLWCYDDVANQHK